MIAVNDDLRVKVAYYADVAIDALLCAFQIGGTMKPHFHRHSLILRVSCLLLVVVVPGAAHSQVATSPRAHVAAPNIFKIIAEGQQQRVMEGTLKPGQKTPPLSHPPGSVVYYLTDCKLKATESGVDIDTSPTAGTVRITPLVNSLTRLNVGKSDCRMLIVERQ